MSASAKQGRVLMLIGWYAVAVAVVGAVVTLARDLPAEIALGWKVWGLVVSILVATAGIGLVAWGRRILRQTGESD